jgi:hypothetical protein
VWSGQQSGCAYVISLIQDEAESKMLILIKLNMADAKKWNKKSANRIPI